MAEANGGGRLNDHEERIARLEAARKELEDSFIVMAHLETKSAARVKEHAEFIADHEQAIRKHNEFVAHHEQAIREHEQAIREMDDKLNALIDVVGGMQGGIESRPS
jgi:flagellar biosynthesis chaperone FliJ